MKIFTIIRTCILCITFIYIAETMATTAYDFEFDNIDGKSKIKLSDYKNKLVIIVNTASLCGFTPQYAGLEKIWNKYKNQGLVIIGIPSDNFGNQEHDTNQEIKNFCSSKYNITFLLTAKTDVKGATAHPFFNWVSRELGFLAAPKWNFYKYFISPEGKLVEWFASTTTPESEGFIKAIEKYLPR